MDAIGLSEFKAELMKALQHLKTVLAADDIAGVEYDTCNTNRARYVHLYSTAVAFAGVAPFSLLTLFIDLMDFSSNS